MESKENQETASFMTVIARLDRLDRVLQRLEEKQNSMSSRRDVCAVESNKECKTLTSALEEVQHKGTLIDRLALLENRVLKLSLEMDEGNTSKSSSSTVHVSETTLKDSSPQTQDDKKFNTQQMQDPPTNEPQERTSSADGFVKEIKAQHKGKGLRNKPQKRWLGLFRLRC